jgi:TRAP-type C4-dicarboxylate transport system permease small subunit
MLYVKIVFVILVIVFVGMFVYQNYGELSKEVTMHIPPMKKSLGPSPMILYFSFALFIGMILTGFPLLIMVIKNAARVKKQNRIISSLKNEISQLQLVNRNLQPGYDTGEEADVPENSPEKGNGEENPE